jgi:hypothetical protein
MAGEGYGTTSIGTGSAQVVGSPSFDLTKLAQPLIQQQKDKVAKEAQKVKQTNKIMGDLKGLGKIGSLRYGAGIEKFKGEIVEKAKKAIASQNIDDLLDLENGKLQLNTLMDLAKKNDALNSNIGQQMLQGGNYWNKEYYEDYQTPLDISGIAKPEDLIGAMSKDADNLRQIVKDKHNPMEFMTKMDGVAKTFYGTQGDFTEDDLKDSLTTLFTNDPNSFDTFRHYEIAAKKDQKLLDQFGGDVTKAAIELAYNDFLPLVGKKPKSSKGGLTINIGGDDKETSFDGYSVSQQTYKEAYGGADEDGNPLTREVKQYVAFYPKPVPFGTFKVPVGGTVDGVPSDGTVVVQDVSFNQTKRKAVLTEDVQWKDGNGETITVKAGQVINEDDIPRAREVLKRTPKFEYKYISEGYTADGTPVTVDAELIAPASVAALKGATGKGALGVYQEKSNKQMQEKGDKNTIPTVGGYKPKKR